MTVESAIVLPLFLMAMVLAAGILNLLYIHREVGAALENTCRMLSAYAYPASHAVGEALPDGGDSLLTVGYAQIHVMRELQEHGLVMRLLDGPVDLLESTVSENGQIIELTAHYRIQMAVGPFQTGRLSFVQKARMHGWTGYREDTLEQDTTEEILVYVTESGTVYHRSASCSYLNPSIRSVSSDSLADLRSEDGSVYYPCELCHASGGNHYITSYGNRWHSDLACSGLKRTIREVPLSQVELIMGACSKCGY